MSDTNSTSQDPSADGTPSIDEISPYGYVPTQWICFLFIGLFAITTVIHLGQAIRFRMWWLLPTAVIAGIGELIGWAGRLWSSYDITSDGFLMQITTTIISPTPLLAANFIILSRIISRLGPEYSRLTPGLYAKVFLCCDLVALVVQAVGGGMASSAKTLAAANDGAMVMLGGILFQMVAISAYVLFALEFFVRYFKDKPVGFRERRAARKHEHELQQRDTEAAGAVSPTDAFSPVDDDDDAADGAPAKPRVSPRVQMTRKIKLAMIGLAFSTLVIFIRSVYRTIELQDGWDGVIIHTQVYFNALDGAMIVLAMYNLNVFHPGYLLAE